MPSPSDCNYFVTVSTHFKQILPNSSQLVIIKKVFDITGKQVKDVSDDLVKSEKSVSASVDLESPSSGIYFVRIEWGKSVLTKKIIVR